MENKKYFNKYIKYKLKYLKLKQNQKGSATNLDFTNFLTDEERHFKLKTRPTILRNVRAIKEDFIMTTYKIAFNFLLKFRPEKLKTTLTDPQSKEDIRKCIIKFFITVNYILENILTNQEYQVLEEREDIKDLIYKCKIYNKVDFAERLYPVIDDELPIQNPDPQGSNQINYNPSLYNLKAMVELLLVNLEFDDEEKLKGKLISFLTSK